MYTVQLKFIRHVPTIVIFLQNIHGIIAAKKNVSSHILYDCRKNPLSIQIAVSRAHRYTVPSVKWAF